MIRIDDYAFGRMRVDGNLAAQGIEMKILPTDRAVVLFTQSQGKGLSLGACFHLTC